MAETLLINYKPHLDHCYWTLINEQGECISQLSQGSLSDISSMAKGKHATVLLDAACLTLHKVNIPSQNRQRQLQAVPFALEEQLASDIEDMHFALGKKTSAQDLPVISINKSLLDTTLAAFKDAGIYIDLLSTDVLALPFVDNSWTIFIDEDNVLIKTDHDMGYYCDRNNLSVILANLLKKRSTPESIHFYHKDDDTHAAELLSSIDISLNIKTYSSHPVEVFAHHLADARQANILQGEYTPKREGTVALLPWKSVAALVGLWILVQMLTASIESWQLEDKNLALTSQIEKEFKLANPAAKNFNNMQKRMQRQLQQLQNGGNDNAPLFLHILSNAAAAFNNKKSIQIQGIVFRSQYVDIDLQADSLKILDELKNELVVNRKLKVVMSTTVEKNKTRGRLRLEAQG